MTDTGEGIREASKAAADLRINLQQAAELLDSLSLQPVDG